MKNMALLVVLVPVASAAMVGCLRTRSEVAVKPVDVNLNITGRLELVITDARRHEEEIAGAKPERTVRPEDIGLPPAPKSDAIGPGTMLPARSAIVTRLDCAGETGDDRSDRLIQQMATRHARIKTMLDGQAVGESHTGFLVPKATLSASQQALIDAENADRTELYKLEAAKKNATVDQVALGYYMARLEHVTKGTWAERYDKSTGRWVWFQWER